MTPKHGDDSLVPKMGPDMFKQVYGGKQFLSCLIELLKNCKDWNATDIWLWTSILSELRILDNGDGMDLTNRRAFVSHAISSARGLVGKAGWFGTGTKHMLFSHCIRVLVVTAPKDDPEWVYIFEFSTKECAEYTINQREIPCKKEKKSKENWPHDFDHGTEITYTLENPRSSKILRGEELAEELSARLPRVFSDILRVDGNLIPRKKIVGKIFSQIEQTSVGQISYEIYRPEKVHDGEGLFFTAGEIGEIPVANLYRVLGAYLKQKFPQILRLAQVCGTICVPWFLEYINEDRFTVDPRIADDPRMEKLLKYLDTLTPTIQSYLKIQEKKKDDESDESIIIEVLERCTAYYSPEGTPSRDLKDPEDTNGGEGDDNGSPSDRQEPPAIRLSHEREYEIGQTVEINASIRKDLHETYSLDSLVWRTDRSRGKDLQKTESGITFTTSEEGQGVVSTTIPGTPFSVGAYYDVVQKRKLSLSLRRAEIEVDSQLTIVARNTDKVSNLQWRLDGVGKLDPASKDRVTYTATRKGVATVRAYDGNNPSVYATCDITVVPHQEKLFCIRGEFFRYSSQDPNAMFKFDDPALTKPVTMYTTGDTTKTGEPIHQIAFNASAPGYQEEKEEGTLDNFFLHAISLEFFNFWCLEYKKIDLGKYQDPRDLKNFLQTEILYPKHELYKELKKIFKDDKKEKKDGK